MASGDPGREAAFRDTGANAATGGLAGDAGPGRGVTARVVALSLASIAAMCWWIAYSEIKTSTTEITCTSLPIGVVFLLFVVCGLNAGVARWRPRLALAPGELAALYVLVAVGSSVAGIGMIGFLTPAIANPVWFTHDRWDRFSGSVPAWWSPRDPDAVRDYFLGQSTLYTREHIMAWIPPLLAWGGFLLLFLLMMLSTAVILRRQWTEYERLSYPIAAVPLAMTLRPDGFTGLMRDRALLLGFFLPVVLQTINNLNWLFPSVPAIPVKPTINGPLDLGPKLTNHPWNALGYFPLAFHPNTIGLAYLLTTDVSFSCWFFYLLRKGLDVFCVAAGFRAPGTSSTSARMPYTAEQGAGAWLCLAALTLWMARGHLRAVVRGALRPELADDSREGMSYRLALAGAAAGFAGCVAFAAWGGLPWSASICLFLVFGATMLALSRIRAEVGTAWCFSPWVTAPQSVVRLFGPGNLDLPAISVLAYHNWYSIDTRSMTAPHLFEAYRIAEQGRLHARKLTAAMALAIVAGIVLASWSVLHLYYIYGAGTAHVNQWRILMGQIPYQIASGNVASIDRGRDTAGIAAAGAGAAMTIALNAARVRFSHWPFHPAGYAIANTFIPDLLWFPFFLGWLAKLLTLRFGGMGGYRRALPFFIGLILGDYVIASLWTFVGMALGIEMYRCFPN